MNCQQKIVGPAAAHASTAWLMQLHIGFQLGFVFGILPHSPRFTAIHVKRLGCCTSFGAVGRYGTVAIHGYKKCFKNASKMNCAFYFF
jgi:hypothetical protein